jgi:exodeoxyribonuclease VII large subunit
MKSDSLFAPSDGAGSRRVYTVSELAASVRRLLEETWGRIWVEGEVSNLRTPPSGHLYFSLKDENAVLGAAAFGGLRRVPSARHLVEGRKVLVLGRFTAYERSGQCQVIVERVEPLGIGELQERFEKLKAMLAAEGLFDEARKRPLPAMPFTVGLVTSPTGAAVRDLINVLTRRFPRVEIVLAPTRVQGEGAAEEIAAAIALQNRLGRAEVLIVGRGGGSIEDLWAFNEEAVVRAVALSRIPVISAVGHEVDFTLCDFAADLRAPTPSAAAELAVRREAEVREALASLAFRLRSGLSRAAEAARARLAGLTAAPVLVRPIEELLGAHRQRLDELTMRLTAAVQRALGTGRERLAELGGRLASLDPRAVLRRGYSMTFDMEGRPLREAAGTAPGAHIRTVLARGQVISVVQESGNDQAE